MRIPVKAQLDGYTPALNPFSEDKLIWYKTKTNGLPSNLVLSSIPITVVIGSSWSRKVGADDPNFEVNVYQTLGHTKFVLAFIIAALIGVLGYIWGLFVYDRLKVKQVPLDKSIELYKKTSLITKDEEYQKQLKLRKNNAWYIIPAAIIMLGAAFSFLFFPDSRNFAGGGFAIMLYITAIFVYLILYYSTVLIARKYLDRKFNVKSKRQNIN